MFTTVRRPALGAITLLALASTTWALGNFCITAPNAVGAGALIDSSGSTSVATADFTLTIDDANPDTVGMFFYGGGAMQHPFGNGFRCVRGAGRGVHRFKGVKRLDASGRVSLAVDFTRKPAGLGPGTILPNTTWYFQFIYRDPHGPGPHGFNLSDGLQVTFTQ